MNIREYIESGVIEAYILGLATEQEIAEIETLSREYADVKKAVDDFEIALQQEALRNAVNPPAHVKSFLDRELANEFSAEETIVSGDGDITASPQVKYLQPRTSSFWTYMAAASVILLVISTALNFYFYSNFKDSSEKYQALLTERNSLQASNATYKKSLELMEDPRMLNIKMQGVPGKEQNLATVFWNVQTKEVYVYPNSMEKTPAGKQYQLWAIVDGKPVSAGMIGDCDILCKMKSIDHAEAFAVTLENEGGSKTPTLTAMYVQGKV